MGSLLGAEIKKAIRGKGLGMEDAAKKLGISRGTLHTRLNGADHDKAFVQLVQERLDINVHRNEKEETLVPEPELINYNIPIRRKKIAVVMLPRDAVAQDIDRIISHLKLMKEAME